MANIYRLIVLLFLSFLSFNSFASFSKSYFYRSPSYSDAGVHSDPSSLCTSLTPFIKFENYASTGGFTYTHFSHISSAPSCKYIVHGVDINNQSKSRDITVSYISFLSCPENSTASASQCTCNAGYEEKNGNSCVLPEPPDPCEGLNEFCAGQFMSETSWDTSGNSRPGSVCKKPSQNLVGASGGTTPRFPGCNRGCSVETYPGVVKYQSPFDDSWLTSGDGKYNGQSCNSDSETVTPEEPKPEEPKPEDEIPCKKGEFSGHVNGVKTCLSSKSKDNDGTTKKETHSDGSTTETITKTTCSNGSCNTTTTTINKDSSGSTTGTSTKEEKETEDEFCQKNPANPLCKKSDSGTSSGTDGKGEGEDNGEGSEFGGSCDSGFTCTGDAIQCAIAKSQHQDSCKLFAPAPAGSVPDGTEEGSAQDLQNNAHVINVQTDLDYSGLGWNRSCPADEDFDIGIAGAKMTIPYSKLCVVLSPMSDIALAITALGLLVWLVAGKKEA